MTQYWFLIAIAILGLFTFCAARNPEFLLKYFVRWLPERWHTPVLSKKSKVAMSSAWAVLVEESANREPAFSRQGNFTDSAGASPLMFSRREQQVVTLAASDESAAWLLRRMADSSATHSQRRWNLVVWATAGLGNIALTLFVGLLAIAIFQSLISIVQHL